MFKEFISIDKKHKINIELIKDNVNHDNIAYFSIINFDYENYKTFLLLLKDVVHHFFDEKVKYVKQYIMYKDKDSFENSEIIINNINDDNIDKENSIILVSTSLEKFTEEIYNSLGLRKI